MAIWGVDCNRVKMSGKMISEVVAANGKKSKLYDNIVEHLSTMDKADIDNLRETFRSWEGKIVGDVDNNRHLALALYAKTHSTNFKEWFGNSKVVDENDEPLMVYHGSPKSFSEFKLPDGWKVQRGIYFTTNIELAKGSGGSSNWDKVSNIYPVFLSLQNPRIETHPYEVHELETKQNYLTGFDSFILNNERRNINFEEIVAFDPNQIKSLFNEGGAVTEQKKGSPEITTQYGYQKPVADNKMWPEQYEDFSQIQDFTERREAVNRRAAYLESKGAKVERGNLGLKHWSDPKNMYYQTGSIDSSLASDVTVDKWKDWFESKGIDYDTLTGNLFDDQGNPLDVNETVDIANRIVRVAAGKENSAIGEAGMHIVTSIIKNVEPKLFKEMMNNIGDYEIFQDVVKQYKDLRAYQTKDGKPNIAKLKEEAIGKVLNEYYILQEEGSLSRPENIKKVQAVQSWWQRILTRLKDWFVGNPFEKAVKEFDKGTYDKKDPIQYVNKLRDLDTGMESYDEFSKNTIDNYKEAIKGLPDKSVIVTHGTVVSLLKSWKESGYSDSVDESMFNEQRINNTHIEEIDHDGKKIYIVRHGESQANFRGEESDKETPLTERGIIQSMSVAELLKDKDINTVVSTDTSRTKETANIIRRELDMDSTFYQKTDDEEGKKLYDKFEAQNDIRYDETNSMYLKKGIDSKEVKPETRVTQIAKKVYSERFPEKKETKKDITDRETGTRLHSYMHDIFKRIIDPVTGKVRDTILPKTIRTQGEDEIYSKLETYLKTKIDQYTTMDPDYRFRAEQILYLSGQRPGKGDIVGTADFIGISSKGAVRNLDWKFMNEKEWDDISAVTQKAHKVQLDQYGKIMRQSYGVKQILESNTVPIKIIYGIGPEQYTLKNIVVGDPDYSNINDKTLLPVVSSQVDIVDKDGNTDLKITSLMRKLNDVGEKIYNKRGSARERRELDKQYQAVSYAIRTAIHAKSYDAMATIGLNIVKAHIRNIREVKAFLDKASASGEDRFKDATAIAKYVDKLLDAKASLDVFKDLKVIMADYMEHLEPEDKEQLNEIFQSIDSNIKYAEDMMYDPLSKKGILDTAAMTIGEFVNIFNIQSLDKQLNIIDKNFLTAGSAPIKTSQAFYKYKSRAEHLLSMRQAEEAKVQDKISRDLTDWMGGSWDNEKLLKSVFKEGRIRGGLISKYSKDFYENIRSAQENNDKQKLAELIDTDAYMADYEQDLERFKDFAEKQVYDAASHNDDLTKRKGTLDQERREKAIEGFKDTYDIRRSVSKRNNRLYMYATDAAWSKEYKYISQKGNEALLNFYDYVTKLNSKAHKIGMFGDYYHSFFPQVRARTLERKVELTAEAMKENILSSFVTEMGEMRYRDELTGELVRSIRGRYLHDLGDDKQVSTDVMKSLSLYASDVIAFEEKDKIEAIAKLLLEYEKNKKVQTYDKGRLVKKETGELIGSENVINYEYLRNYINHSVYGERTIGEEKGFKTTIGGEEQFVTYRKMTDTALRWFSLKTLGFNVSTGMSNLFGGAANSLINSGRDFTAVEFGEAYKTILSAKLFRGEKGKKFLSLYEKFVPFTEQVSIHLGKHASKKQVLNWLSSDGIMVLMRKSDDLVQMANASVYFQNTMIENGKLINIRQYVKDKYDYANLYKLPETERNKIRENIEAEVKELQKTRNLFNDKNIKYNDDNHDIEWGVKDLDETQVDLRQKIQQLTVDCLGNRTPGEVAQINMSLFGGALTTFRGWIPRLVEKRYGGFKYHAGAGTYEIGRMRMLGDVLFDHTQGKLTNIKNSLGYGAFGVGESSIVDIAKRQYQRRLAQTAEIEGTSETMFSKTVTEAEFVDQYLHGVKAQVRELMGAIALTAAFYVALSYAKSLKKDQDNYGEIGRAKYTAKLLDKFSDELGFFYNYSSFTSIIGTGSSGGGPIPILTTLSDLGKFLKDSYNETSYLIQGDEEKAANVHLLKYPISWTPVLNQFSQMLAMGNEEWNDFIYGKKHGTKMFYGVK